jgi:dipeptidyl-peptidase-4
MKRILFLLLLILPVITYAQGIRWTKDGNGYYVVESNNLIRYSLPSMESSVLLSVDELTPEGGAPLKIRNFIFSEDESRMLVFTNTKKVWRLETRGDYWVMDVASKKLHQLGKGLSPSSLMFAEFSPDARKVAYVSQYNVYVEDIEKGTVTPLTTDGTRKHINGTFDWAYEEEFSCRDGIQWSPDSRHLAFWQIDATRIRDFYMINNTDSVYSKIIPVEYPTAGQSPSPARIGIVDTDNGKVAWAAIPGEPSEHYLPRIEWNSAQILLVQQLNRKQNTSVIYKIDPITGAAQSCYSETDSAWIDVLTPWENSWSIDFRHEIQWLKGRKEFLWFSEKDGWRHMYRVTLDGHETLITKGDFDVLDIRYVDETNNVVYFLASPTNATQKYLYKTKLDGKGKAERVSPETQSGTHDYLISPNGKFARHTFSNSATRPMMEWVSLPRHTAFDASQSIDSKLPNVKAPSKKVEFFKVKTEDGVEMDGWMVKPANFDPSKKYPVLFFVYTEPWGANVHDSWGTADNYLFDGDLAKEGYIYVSLDNRGTPVPKGREWRKSIYRKIGVVNIRDQAMGAKEIMKWPYVDASRIAVWGWSGGGAATLNLMFQYPEIYTTGIAVAAVTNQLTYDNIYQERFMGIPQENMEDFVKGSPLTYAKNLKGNLLYIHGTGDDNVHYANAEMLINELVKHGKQFQLMIYPNRTHGISEGEGTSEHLSALYTEFLRKNCPGGGK